MFYLILNDHEKNTKRGYVNDTPPAFSCPILEQVSCNRTVTARIVSTNAGVVD